MIKSNNNNKDIVNFKCDMSNDQMNDSKKWTLKYSEFLIDLRMPVVLPKNFNGENSITKYTLNAK